MYKVGDKVKFVSRGVEVEGTVVEGPMWMQVGGRSATKHNPNSSAVMGRGMRVRCPIVMKDGSIYKVHGQMAPGITTVKVLDDGSIEENTIDY